MFYDDLVADSGLYLRSIFEFLGADPGFVVDTSKRHNKGLVRRDTNLSRLLHANFPGRQWLRRHMPGSTRDFLSAKLTETTHSEAQPLQDNVRDRLLARFRDDVQRLQPLVDRDLSAWIS